jgi:hypothetical protein
MSKTQNKQCEQVEYVNRPERWGIPLVSITMGAVLAGSENRGVKALGAGIVMASALTILKKLARLVDEE